MRPIVALSLTAVALIGWSFIAKASTVKKLNFILSDADITTEGFTPVLRLMLGIQNPTSNSFTVLSLVGDVYVNDKLAGNVSSFTKTLIASNAQTAYQVDVRLGLFGLASEIIAIITGSAGIAARIRLKGHVNVDGTAFPVDTTMEIL